METGRAAQALPVCTPLAVSPVASSPRRIGRSRPKPTPRVPLSHCRAWNYSAPVEIRRVLVCVVLCLSLTACAGTLSTAPVEFTEGHFVGRPLSEMVAALGPPTTKSMLDDRNMAVEWVYYTQCSRSAMANSAKPNSPTLSDWTVVSWRQTEACSSAR
jgi:hypothetical protein